MQKYRQLDALYATIPEVGCRGLCGINPANTACGPIKVTPLEYQRLREKVGKEALQPKAINVCPLLQAGRCQAYAVRPLICHLWGAIDTPLLRCPWGCKPATGFQTQEFSRAALKAVARISGTPPKKWKLIGRLAVNAR
jgi:hypothetical protein